MQNHKTLHNEIINIFTWYSCDRKAKLIQKIKVDIKIEINQF